LASCTVRGPDRTKGFNRARIELKTNRLVSSFCAFCAFLWPSFFFDLLRLSMSADAISCYHDLLASGSALAADSHAALEKAQQLRGLSFGERPVCTVLRPRFLTPAQSRLPHDAATALLPAFQAAF